MRGTRGWSENPQTASSLATPRAAIFGHAPQGLVNGHLTLPPHLIEAFGLPFLRNGRAVLGDGSSVTFDGHELNVQVIDGGHAFIRPLPLF